jgi:hypothetical protein
MHRRGVHKDPVQPQGRRCGRLVRCGYQLPLHAHPLRLVSGDALDRTERRRCQRHRAGGDLQERLARRQRRLFGGLPNTVSTSVATAIIYLNGSTDYVEGYVYLPAGITTIWGQANITYMHIAPIEQDV